AIGGEGREGDADQQADDRDDNQDLEQGMTVLMASQRSPPAFGASLCAVRPRRRSGAGRVAGSRASATWGGTSKPSGREACGGSSPSGSCWSLLPPCSRP